MLVAEKNDSALDEQHHFEKIVYYERKANKYFAFFGSRV
jgi:hypothetical protein